MHWQYDATAGGWEFVLAPTLAALNVLSHHVLWRRGWLIRVDADGKRVWRKRFHSRPAAMAVLPAILATVSEAGITAHALRS